MDQSTASKLRYQDQLIIGKESLLGCDGGQLIMDVLRWQVCKILLNTGHVDLPQGRLGE